jgi:hypothetical protein
MESQKDFPIAKKKDVHALCVLVGLTMNFVAQCTQSKMPLFKQRFME